LQHHLLKCLRVVWQGVRRRFHAGHYTSKLTLIH